VARVGEGDRVDGVALGEIWVERRGKERGWMFKFEGGGFRAKRLNGEEGGSGRYGREYRGKVCSKLGKGFEHWELRGGYHGLFSRRGIKKYLQWEQAIVA
jgi:hypothetical protein